MKVDVEQVDTCVRRLLVEVPVDRVNREFNALYSHLQSRVKLPGFRPGKVPRRVLENYYRHSIEQEALQKLVPDALSEALVQEGLHSVGQPQIDQIDLTKDQPLRFVATTQIIPDFTVADYRDWHMQRRIAAVDASQVEEAMQQLRERHAELHTVSGRAVVAGDHVLMNYQGFLAGQPLPEAQGTNVALEVGAGLFLPEIEAGLIGLEPGMERTIAVQLSEDHRDAAVAGQQVEFHVTMVEIKEKILPELDDEFARAYEDAESLDALRKRVLGELEDAARQQADEVLRRDILAQLVAANPIAVPDVLVQEHMRQLYFRHLRQETGRDIREEEAQVDPESLRDTYGEPALEAVRGQVLLHRIQEDLGVTVTPEEVDAEVRALATRLAQNPEALKQAMERHGNLQALEAGLRERKVFQAMMEVIQIIDVSADTSTSSS